MTAIAKNRLNSTWTPLNNEELNHKSTACKQAVTAANDPLSAIFNERRTLVVKWFDKCNDNQRLSVLHDLIGQCSGRQLEQTAGFVARRKPVLHNDFIRSFPRVLSIYLFSFLDPRSLCRCAQVSWHWKELVEVDQLWINKCLRLGWFLTFTPSPYETGLWKRLYIENILALKSSSALTSRSQASSLVKATSRSDRPGTADVDGIRGGGHGTTAALPLSLQSSAAASGKRPPWKGSDPAPRDTWRNNYLDNEDEVEKVNRLRKRGVYGAESEEVTRRARNRVNTGRQSARQRSNSLTRPPSAVPSIVIPERPAWAMTATADAGNSSRVGALQPTPIFNSLNLDGVGTKLTFDKTVNTR